VAIPFSPQLPTLPLPIGGAAAAAAAGASPVFQTLPDLGALNDFDLGGSLDDPGDDEPLPFAPGLSAPAPLPVRKTVNPGTPAQHEVELQIDNEGNVITGADGQPLYAPVSSRSRFQDFGAGAGRFGF
jgi:hypothetical protein